MCRRKHDVRTPHTGITSPASSHRVRETVSAHLLNDTPGSRHHWVTFLSNPGHCSPRFQTILPQGKQNLKIKGVKGEGWLLHWRRLLLPCPLLAGYGWSKAVKASSSVTLMSPECWDISAWISLWCLFPAVKLWWTRTYGFLIPLHYYSPLLDRGVFEWKQAVDSCYWI